MTKKETLNLLHNERKLLETKLAEAVTMSKSTYNKRLRALKEVDLAIQRIEIWED